MIEHSRFGCVDHVVISQRIPVDGGVMVPPGCFAVVICCLWYLLPLVALASEARPAANATQRSPKAEWISKSDQNALVLVDCWAKFFPEGFSSWGATQFDGDIQDLNKDRVSRFRKATQGTVREFRSRLANESDPRIRQDLEILIKAAEERLQRMETEEKHLVFYFDALRSIYGGISLLLNEQVASTRRPAALQRLLRYVGMEKGYRPLLLLAIERSRESFVRPQLVGPLKAHVETHLANAKVYLQDIAQAFRKYKLPGWKKPFGLLKKQYQEYRGFIKKEILPRVRTDYRLPKVVYRSRLCGFGVDIDPDVLAERARSAFWKIQSEMQTLAPLVAKSHGFSAKDYRQVIRALKKDQIPGGQMLDHYRLRLAQLEEIVKRERIVTLPQRAVKIRLATKAESASVPNPHLRVPRLIGNTGELGELIIPLTVPGTPGESGRSEMSPDDDSFPTSSWTLAAHETRPGHELQFASMVENGVSMARAIFAMNTANVEGWVLYMEATMKPYFPLDGQLLSLQARLLRAARAFLDPDLQAGRISPEEAKRLLLEQVVLSEPFANQEVERYSFRLPGQATSYFYGYIQWVNLKARMDVLCQKKIHRQEFHDFVLSQGVLPINMIAEATKKEFGCRS